MRSGPERGPPSHGKNASLGGSAEDVAIFGIPFPEAIGDVVRGRVALLVLDVDPNGVGLRAVPTGEVNVRADGDGAIFPIENAFAHALPQRPLDVIRIRELFSGVGSDELNLSAGGHDGSEGVKATVPLDHLLAEGQDRVDQPLGVLERDFAVHLLL